MDFFYYFRFNDQLAFLSGLYSDVALKSHFVFGVVLINDELQNVRKKRLWPVSCVLPEFAWGDLESHSLPQSY